MIKECVTCKESKDTNLFSKHKKAKDGLQSSCKACTADYQKLHRTADLLRKDPVYYSQFQWTEPNDLPYYWPVTKNINITP